MSNPQNHYRLMKKIGVGGFSVIHLAENVNGRKVAIKSIRKKNKKNLDYYYREAKIHYILSQSDEQLFVQIYDVMEDENYVHLVLEYLEGGDLLANLIEQLKLSQLYSEIVLRNMVRSLLKAVRLLHSKNIVHRDIKLENLLLVEKDAANPIIKLADFGLSVEVTANNLTSVAGTRLYMAPENYKGEPYGKPVDIWAIGIITYALFTGSLPFGNHESICRARILKGDVPFRERDWENISAEAKDFIKFLLTNDQKLRPNAEEALNHPWFQGETFNSTLLEILQ